MDKKEVNKTHKEALQFGCLMTGASSILAGFGSLFHSYATWLHTGVDCNIIGITGSLTFLITGGLLFTKSIKSIKKDIKNTEQIE